MKRFTLLMAVTAIAASFTLTACGNAEAEKKLTADLATCNTDKAATQAKFDEATKQIAQLTADLAAAKATPTPAAEATKGGKTTGKATPAAAATTAAPAATPKGVLKPTLKINVPKPTPAK